MWIDSKIKSKAYWLKNIVFLIIFISWVPAFSYAAKIIMKSQSLREGIASDISVNRPVINNSEIFKSKYFQEPQNQAQKAGIDLKEVLDQPAISGFNSTNKRFFQLFYNTAIAPSCRREYLVQRVKITKSYYNTQDQLYKKTCQYLVEVFKTKNKALKGGDRHIRSYSLNGASKRITLIEAEIGCGTIHKEATGRKWPYSKKILYKEVQGYKSTPGIYHKVKFDFSQEYTFGGEFSEDGIKSVKSPYFIR